METKSDLLTIVWFILIVIVAWFVGKNTHEVIGMATYVILWWTNTSFLRLFIADKDLKKVIKKKRKYDRYKKPSSHASKDDSVVNDSTLGSYIK